ncbi:MAG TPA: TIGR03118 family protein, partial [Pirellulales bacterium]|nr:TIGR03118 family protein [Pirellulales bacterium]
PGGGIIDVYDANGNLLNRFASGSPLDGPWGMALAPTNFGQFSGDLLVGNYGNGQINAFDPATGKSLGALTDAAGQPITVPGLWGLTFGNGTAGDTTALFYAAGPNFFGRPIPPGPQPLTSSDGSTTIAYPIPRPQGQLGEIVAPATPTLSAVATTLTAREGVPFQAEVAAFGSTQPPSPQANPLPDYSATIAWGDGAVSPGTVEATGNGGFLVAGKHAYAEEGTQTYVVTINDKAGDTVTGQGTVTIDDPPLLAVGVPVSVTTGTTVSGSTMAVFVDLGGAESLSDYSATIDWGDGTPPSPGMIGTATANDTAAAAPLLSSTASDANLSLSAAAALQKLIVTGDHSYASNGSYWAMITVTDDGGSKVAVRSLVVVGGAATNVSFVEQAFRDILHRDGDPAGLTYWQTQLANGLSPAQVAIDLTHSTEYFTNVIAPDYQQFLGRAADASGVNYWISQMQQGLTDQQLAAAFVASPEFYANAGGTNTAFVDALYQALLNRPADSQGEAYWVAQLNGGASRQSVALLFATSSEQVTNQVLDDYFNVLGRSPSPAEVAFWTNAIQSGATNEQVLAAFIASPEFNQELSSTAA